MPVLNAEAARLMLMRMNSLGGFGLVTFAALAVFECGEGQRELACTAIGCSNDVVLSAEVPASARELRVQVCRDGDCREVDLDAQPDCAVWTGPRELERACYEERGLTPRVEVTLELQPDWSRDDSYSLRITERTTEAVLVDAKGEATYSVSYPNGRECDGDGCWRGAVHFESGP